MSDFLLDLQGHLNIPKSWDFVQTFLAFTFGILYILETTGVGMTQEDTVLSSVYALLEKGNTKPLAELVEERYRELGLSLNQFCRAVELERKTWERIRAGEAPKTDTLIKLSYFIGLDVKQVVQLFVAHTTPESIREIENTKKNSFVVNNFDLKALKKIRFIRNIQDLDEIERRITTFFGMESIFEYDTSTKPLFSRTRIPSSDRMLNFWNNLIRKQFQTIQNPNPFDEEKLLSVVPKIRESTIDVRRGFGKFVRALYECGLVVVVETYCSGTGIRGGTFSIKGRPYIVLTNIFQRYDTLWFSLAHELCHVINDMEYIERLGFHLSGEDDLLTDELQEDLANTFAQKMFLSDENAAIIEKFIPFEDVVRRYAQGWNVHPSMIYGNYLGKHENDYPRYRKYLIDSGIAIQNIQVENPWERATLQEAATAATRFLTNRELMPTS